MTTFRISYRKSDGTWSVLQSGSRVSIEPNKRAARKRMNRLARPGDVKVTERKDGSVMSRQKVEKPDAINAGARESSLNDASTPDYIDKRDKRGFWSRFF